MQTLYRYHDHRWLRITTDWAKEKISVVFERTHNRVSWRPGDGKAYEDAFKVLKKERENGTSDNS